MDSTSWSEYQVGAVCPCVLASLHAARSCCAARCRPIQCAPHLQANYRAVIRAHKDAIAAIKSFWQLLLHSDVSMTSLQRHFLRIEKARAQAERSYRVVMVRAGCAEQGRSSMPAQKLTSSSALLRIHLINTSTPPPMCLTAGAVSCQPAHPACLLALLAAGGWAHGIGLAGMERVTRCCCLGSRCCLLPACCPLAC